MHNPASIRMKDVAEQAGVSRSTVSRSLRGDLSIPEATRKRVCETAQAMGYRRNAFVETLMSNVRAARMPGFKPVIAFLILNPNQEHMADRPSYGLFRKGAQQQCDRMGYDMQPFWPIRDGIPIPRLSQILRTRNIRGVVVAPDPDWRHHPTEGWNDLWNSFSLSLIGYSIPSVSLHRAAPHLYFDFLMALDRLAELGYRRIGVAERRSLDQRLAWQITAATAAWQSLRPVRERIPPLLKSDWERDAFFRWFEKQRPDVLLTLGSQKIRKWLVSAGIRIPEDVSFSVMSTYGNAKTAGVDQRFEVVGAASVDLVIGQLHRNESGIPRYPKTVLIEGVWVDGTDAPPRS